MIKYVIIIGVTALFFNYFFKTKKKHYIVIYSVKTTPGLNLVGKVSKTPYGYFIIDPIYLSDTNGFLHLIEEDGKTFIKNDKDTARVAVTNSLKIIFPDQYQLDTFERMLIKS